MNSGQLECGSRCLLQMLPTTGGMGDPTPKLGRSVAKTTWARSGPDDHFLQLKTPHGLFAFSSPSSHRSGCQNGRLELGGKSVCLLPPPSSSDHCSGILNGFQGEAVLTEKLSEVNPLRMVLFQKIASSLTLKEAPSQKKCIQRVWDSRHKPCQGTGFVFLSEYQKIFG